MAQDESSVDVCKPIKSILELDNFMDNPPYWAQLVIPLVKRSKIIRNSDLYVNDNVCHFVKNEMRLPSRYEYGSVPKTLVCHDMKNGYHDDSSINGTDNYAAYSFYHWAAIDMFVYFSHHFITIPPLGWINVAHKHGVQILGTLITEWQDGYKICEEILKSEDSMQKFVHQLVTVTKYFKIDGWLLNIENKVDKVDMLLKFVKCLTQKMHHENPNSVVLWYDSVTNKGTLEWQNCLNNINMEFFNACDGIFTNYCWKLSHLETSVETAGSRRHDVFIGVDVWGRNFWGGGCFNTVEAVKEIHKLDLSMAIFAPAWTHEGIQFIQAMDQQYKTETKDKTKSCSTKHYDLHTKKRKIDDSKFFMTCALREHFVLRESALWNSFWPYLNTRGPSQLPFQTFFCLGAGEKRRVDGEVTNDSLWFNLREQEYQISVPLCSNSYVLESVPEKSQDPKSSTSDTIIKDKKREKRDDTDSIAEDSQTKIGEDIGKLTNSKIDENLDQVQDSNECELHSMFNQNCSKCNTEEKNVEETVTQTKVINSESSPKESKAPIKKFIVRPNLKSETCISLYNEDCLRGGSCIKISPVNPDLLSVQDEIIRLLICEFLCDHNFIVYYAVKQLENGEDQDVNLLISLKNNSTGKTFNVVLTEQTTYPQNLDRIIVSPENKNDEVTFKKLQENLLSNHSGFYVPILNEKNWKIRYFFLKFPNSTMLEINCELTKRKGSILLGGLGVAKDIVNF